MLAKVERAKPGPRPGGVVSAGLTQLSKDLQLDHQTALEAQRIGTLPEEELRKTLEQARGGQVNAVIH
jgi:hypothetical protein